jgi:hypothetical protein
VRLKHITVITEAMFIFYVLHKNSINKAGFEVLTAVTMMTAKLCLLPGCAAFLLGLLFNPVNGGDMYSRSIEFPPSYTAVQPRRPYFSHC